MKDALKGANKLSKFVEKYFSILKDYFGVLVERISKKQYSSRAEYLQAITEVYPISVVEPMLNSLYEELMRLDWGSQETTIQRLGGLKTSYIGSMYMHLRPVEIPDFLKKMGLYCDTVIMPDHALSDLLTWKKRGTGEYATFLEVAGHVTGYLHIEDLFISDLHPPMCSLAPSIIWSLEERGLLDTADRFVKEANPTFASDVFGQSFASPEELAMFLSKMKNFNDFISFAKKPEMVITAEGLPCSIEHLKFVQDYYYSKYLQKFPLSKAFESMLRSRFPALIYTLMSHGKLTSTFATDLRGVWGTLLWFVRNSNETMFERLKENLITKDMMIMNALGQEDLKWLGNIPLDKIRELRERGELQDLRDLMGKNIQEIQNVADEDFATVGRQVMYNLEEAFKKHDAEAKDLNEKYKRKYEIDVASIVVSGGLGFVSAFFPPLALATGISSVIVGGGSIIETVKDFFEKRERLKELQKKPVAMLFNARKLQ